MIYHMGEIGILMPDNTPSLKAVTIHCINFYNSRFGLGLGGVLIVALSVAGSLGLVSA